MYLDVPLPLRVSFYVFICVTISLLLLSPTSAQAYVVELFPPDVRYEPVSVTGALSDKRTILGELNNAPHLYEFRIVATSTFAVVLYAVDEDDPDPQFAGIVVRQEPRGGVHEVARLHPADADWSLWREPLTRMKYRQGPSYQTELTPGTYQFEVSTPDNDGRYAVTIGTDEVSVGYLTLVRNIYRTQQFHGAHWWALLGTLPMFIPLAFGGTVGVAYCGVRFARRRGLLK